MSEQPDLSSLPNRMRYAADVLDEANKQFGKIAGWYAGDLRGTASLWEAEELRRRNTARDQLSREIKAVEVADAEYPHWVIANALIESGWRKGDPA
jgi:hypothetical protein